MILQLEKLGLSEKEAKVYLAALELGSSSVMNISRKAGINRATTYFQIESLMKKGLMSSVTRGKKRYFAATSPDNLLRLLEIKERKIKQEREDFQKILPELKTLFATAEERPKVRFFEGKEGIKSVNEDIIKSKFKSLEEFVPLDLSYELFPPRLKDHRHRILKVHKRIPMRAIYTSKKGPILPYKEKGVNLLRRFIPPEKFPFSAQITIYGNKAAFTPLTDKLIGVIIEDKKIAESLQAIFNLAWEQAKKYQK